MAWLELPMKVVVSCDKLGRGDMFFMLIREDWEPTELKHLSRWRKRKQYAISLVTASETDIEQTESRFVNCGRCGV